MQVKSDPDPAMPPIQLPPGFPNWPSTSSGAGGQQLNGFNNGQHHAVNMHGAGAPLPNGGHHSAPGPVCFQTHGLQAHICCRPVRVRST